MELNREQVIKDLEWKKLASSRMGSVEVSAEQMESYYNLIKELTEENKAWQKQLITTEEKSGKAYYDLACEVEDLRNENEKLKERLEREAKCQYDLCGQIVDLKSIAEQYQKQFEYAKSDTVREFAERLNKHFCHDPAFLGVEQRLIMGVVDQIAKEMLGDGYDT